jgi:hypothetical protein
MLSAALWMRVEGSIVVLQLANCRNDDMPSELVSLFRRI